MHRARHLWICVLFPAACALALAAAFAAPATGVAKNGESGRQALSARKADGEIAVKVGEKEFTRYKFHDTQKTPYFWPVNGPRSGKSVTTESSQPYPHHHSLFFGCDRVNGGNYWQQGLERGRIDSEKVRIVKAAGPEVVIEDRCRWIRPGAPDVIEDHRRWTISAPRPGLRLIEADITLKALVDVHVERTNHSLFSIRVVHELSPKGGGNLVNANGQQREKATFGKKASWCSFYGARAGVTEGIAILVHPENPWSPCTWFTRDYGFISPTPMYWIGAKGWDLPKGKSVRLRYLVVVYEGDPEKAGLDKIWKAWAKSIRVCRLPLRRAEAGS